MGAALRVVTEEYRVSERASDDTVARIEETVALAARHERELWGSRDNDGIVPSIKSLATTVADLAKTVADIGVRVSGEDGHGAQIRQLRKDMDERHAENLAKQARQQTWITGIGIGMFVELIRIAYNIMTDSHVLH
jgi:hypothetical protein